MIVVLALTIVSGVLVVSLAVNYFFVVRAPQMIYNIGEGLVGATIEKYIPELQPSVEGSAGRPTEGIMGILSTPIGQNIMNMILQRIQGSGSAKSGYDPGIK